MHLQYGTIFTSILHVGSFLGVKNGRCVTLTPEPLLVPWSRTGRAIHLLPIWAVRPVRSLSACKGCTSHSPLILHVSA